VASDSASLSTPDLTRRRRPWWWWTIWIVVALVLGVTAVRAKFTTDLEQMLPNNDRDLNRILTFLHERGASRLLAIEAWSDGDKATSDQVTQALVDLGAQLHPLGAQTLPQPGPDEIAKLLSVVEDHLPLLVDSQALDVIRARIQPAALHAYLTAMKERASRPDDALVGSFVRRDVLAIGPQEMLALQKTSGGASFANGVVSHPDGVHFMLPMTVDFDPADTHRTFMLMDTVWAAVHANAQKGIIFEPIGAYRHFDDNMKSLYIDFFMTIPVGVALIILVLWSLSRSWGSVAAMYLPALLGLAGAVSAVSISQGQVPLPLIGFAASLMGVAVDYGIQMTYALRSGDYAHVRSPLLRSFVVSACAFGALATSTVPALHSLGLMVLCGVAVAYVSARYLLPSVVTPAHRPDPWIRVTGPVLRVCERWRWQCAGAALAITLVLLPGLWHLTFLSDIQRMDGSKPATRAALDTFLKRWGNLEPSNFLVDTQPNLDDALSAIAKARIRLGLPPSALERALPDSATQDAHLAAWNAFWTAHRAQFLKDFTAACTELHMRPQGFSASLEKYDVVPTTDKITLEDWQGTPLQTLFATLVLQTDTGWQVSSPIDIAHPSELVPIETHARELSIEPVWIASRAHLAKRLVEVLRSDLARRAVAITIAVGIAVSLLVRSPRKILAMLLPPAIAMLWTFGILGLMHAELTPFTVLVAAFVGGIGIDCAVFLAQPEHRRSLVTPVIGCIATAVAGTAVMLYARHPLLSGVGGTLTIGMISCLIASLLLTPALAGKDTTTAQAP